ncbi:hypothetical protein LSAT2_012877 [Lamellibrachia satsuma]|nr:hypothetical protein LSAT2_012877 [Lamellibrachia satsuma]
MIHPYATDIGISKFDAVFLVSIMGICSGVSRFLVGLLSDFNIVKKKYIYQAATLANGIVLCLCPIVRPYVYLAIMSGLCGFFSGTAVVLAPVLIAEELGTANLPVAVGFLYSISGGICMGSAVLIGFLRDVTGQWNDSFFVIGSSSLVAAIINLAEPWAHRYGQKQKCDA